MILREIHTNNTHFTRNSTIYWPISTQNNKIYDVNHTTWLIFQTHGLTARVCWVTTITTNYTRWCSGSPLQGGVGVGEATYLPPVPGYRVYTCSVGHL